MVRKKKTQRDKCFYRSRETNIFQAYYIVLLSYYYSIIWYYYSLLILSKFIILRIALAFLID